MRKFLAAAALFVLSLGVCMAEEINGKIVSVEGNKITIEKKGRKGAEGTKVTVTAADNVKISKAKRNKELKKIEAGEALTVKASELKPGALVSVVTEGDKATEIRVFEGRKKGERKKKNNQ